MPGNGHSIIAPKIDCTEAKILAETRSLVGFFEMTEENYRPAIGINQSLLRAGRHSVKHLRHAIENPSTQTPAMRLGILVHTAVFEPEKFFKETIVSPELNLRTKAGKAEYQEFQEANSKSTIVTKSDYQWITEIAATVTKDDFCQRLINPELGHRELAAFGFLQHNLLCKGKVDFYNPGLNAVIDLKTTQCANEYEFQKSIRMFGYDMQAAFYLDICNSFLEDENKVKYFIVIAVEKTKPYAVNYFQISEKDIEIGRTKYQKCLDIYKEYLSGSNDGFAQELKVIHANF